MPNFEFKKRACNVYTYFIADFKVETDNELTGTCPFCTKENHFYMNTVSATYSCKKCNEEGSYQDFLAAIYKRIQEGTTDEELLRFTAQKGVPLPALKKAKVAYYANKFWLPAYDAALKVCDLRHRSLLKKEMSMKGGKKGVVGLETLNGKKGNCFITEGYSDALALRWLFDRCGKNWKAVSFPGCNTCDTTWAARFEGWDIIICFDNDPEAEGEFDESTNKVKGTYKVAAFLGQTAKSVKYLVWPEERNLPKGYDVRQFVISGKKNPENTLKEFVGLIKPKHCHYYRNPNNDVEIDIKPTYSDSEATASAIIQKTIDAHAQLNINYKNAIKVGLATAISQHFPGSSNIFMLLVGPVASGKTLITGAYEKAARALYESTLTSTALVSGWGLGQSTIADPSLMARVNNRCMVLKDLTEVFANEQEAAVVFSILRGAYDGMVERTFGTGKRSYRTNMSFLGGVTDSIRGYNDNHLGNRFLMYNLEATKGEEELIQEKALNMQLFGGESLADLQEMVDAFLNRDWCIDAEKLAGKIPNWFRQKLKPLTRLAALLKSKVIRHQYGFQAGQIAQRHRDETGNRIVVQLEKLAFGLALIDDKPFIDEEIYKLLYKVAFDTVECFQTEIILTLLEAGVPLSVDNIGAMTKIPDLFIKLQDAEFLGLIEPVQKSNKQFYQPRKGIKDLWKRSKI